MQRLCFTLVLFLSALFLPIWVTALIAMLGITLYPSYIEAVGIMLVSDLLYGAPEARFLGILFVASGSALIVLVLAEMLKRKIKFYQN